jgi:hypothetical protein
MVLGTECRVRGAGRADAPHQESIHATSTPIARQLLMLWLAPHQQAATGSETASSSSASSSQSNRCAELRQCDQLRKQARGQRRCQR